jgi:uncharacterized membrane protein
MRTGRGSPPIGYMAGWRQGTDPADRAYDDEGQFSQGANRMKFVAAYAVALIVFLALDALWLGVVAKSFYMSRIGELILDQPRWGVAVIFYAVYVVGLVYFAIAPGMAAGSAGVAALNGALFGFFAYLTYNATNLSTLKGYDPVVAIVDTSWGTLLGATVSFATVLVMSRFS